MFDFIRSLIWRLLTPTTKIKVEDPTLQPTRAHPTDAGLDLKADKTTILQKGHTYNIGTGVKAAIPVGYVGILSVRSSIGKRGIQLINQNGWIDSSYRGEIRAMVRNVKDENRTIARGEKFVQLVVVPIALKTKYVNNLNTTERGENGFGSTGTV